MVRGRTKTADALMNILMFRCVGFGDCPPLSPPSYIQIWNFNWFQSVATCKFSRLKTTSTANFSDTKESRKITSIFEMKARQAIRGRT